MALKVKWSDEAFPANRVAAASWSEPVSVQVMLAVMPEQTETEAKSQKTQQTPNQQTIMTPKKLFEFFSPVFDHVWVNKCLNLSTRC